MKAQRRHELQTNDLADWLSRTINQAQPHAKLIAGLAVAAVLVVLAVVYLSGRADKQMGPAWEEYYQAAAMEGAEQRIQELKRVADLYPDTPAGLWALQTAGDAQLMRGADLFYKNRLDGEDELQKAESSFLAVLDKASDLPGDEGTMLRRRATWGLAQTYESLAEVDKAIEQYDAVAKTWPDSALGKASAKRVEYLNGMRDWFGWYASIDPKSITPTPRRGRQPPGSEPPRQPQPYDDLPDDPDLNLPGPLGLGDIPFDLDGGADSTDETPDDSGPLGLNPESLDPEDSSPAGLFPDDPSSDDLAPAGGADVEPAGSGNDAGDAPPDSGAATTDEDGGS